MIPRLTLPPFTFRGARLRGGGTPLPTRRPAGSGWWFAAVASLAAIVLAYAPRTVRADDWWQWRGPNRNGVSEEKGLLREWPQGGPRLVWQVKDLGGGYSTPAVVKDRLYLLENAGLEDEFVRARSVEG